VAWRARALSGSAALSVVSTLFALTANPAAVSPAAAPAALAGELPAPRISKQAVSHALCGQLPAAEVLQAGQDDTCRCHG